MSKNTERFLLACIILILAIGYVQERADSIKWKKAGVTAIKIMVANEKDLIFFTEYFWDDQKRLEKYNVLHGNCIDGLESAEICGHLYWKIEFEKIKEE